MKVNVLVTGGNGQLGSSIRSIFDQYPHYNFIFADRDVLDITNVEKVSFFFKTTTVHWCINCAAYTAVDNAEIDRDLAYQINVLGAINIAKACQEYEVKLIQLSTDFVFDGSKKTPYKELDLAKPQSVYGHTKLKSEEEVQKLCPTSFIVRTSWLYSEFGHNFMKTMVRLASEQELIRVVDDQIGSPTYAVDLAKALIQIISDDKTNFGIFHYANQGEISWFEFAKGIFELIESKAAIEPILTKDYVTLAKRPAYSVLDTTKISGEMGLEIPFWKDSLIKALNAFRNYGV